MTVDLSFCSVAFTTPLVFLIFSADPVDLTLLTSSKKKDIESEVEDYMDKWLAKKIVATTVSSREAKTMKQKRKKMKTQEVREGADKKLRHVDGDVPLSIRSKGEEYKDSSSKKEIEDGSSTKDCRSKGACGSKDLCGSKTKKENQRKCENGRKNTLPLLC